jgi:fatty-acyl-CoA synthase
MPDNLTLGHIVRRNAEQFPNRTAMICRDRTYSWAEYDLLVNRAANALTALGVAFGDHVAALGWNSVEYFQIYHGAAKIGAVFGTVTGPL